MGSSVLYRASLLVALACAGTHADAATCTWTGNSSTSNAWSQALNWLCGSAPGVPADGDTLVFPEVAARKTNANDIAGLDAASMVLTGANYDIGGTGIGLATGIFANVAGSGPVVVDPVVRLDVAVTGSGAFTCAGVRGFEVAGDVTLGTIPFTVDAGCGVTISGGVGGAAAITKTGTGTLTLSGANNYTGSTTIQQGTLNAASPSALGAESAPTTVGAAGTIALSNTGSISEPLVMGVNVSSGAIAMRNLVGNNTWKGPIALAGTATIETLPPFALELSGGVQGAADAGIVKTGTGTLILSSSNTYGGDTRVGQGVLRSQDGGALGPGGETRIDAGATLELVAVSVANESLVLNGSVAGGGSGVAAISGSSTWTGTIRVDGTGAAAVHTDPGSVLTVVGVVSGDAGLAKVGTGTVVFAGGNTYRGLTTVSDGLLVVAFGSTLGTDDAGTTVEDGTTLAFIGHPSTAAAISNERLVLNGTGFAGTGALQMTDVGNLTGPIDLASTATIATGPNASLGLLGPIAGAGFTKTGAGQLSLTATNTYTGTTTVSGGTLILSNASALGGGGAAGGTVVQSGAQLELADTSVAGETLTLSGTGISNAGALISLGGNNTWGGPIVLAQDTTIGAAADTLSLGGVVSGSAGLTKAGPGTLVLNQTNTYTGTTTVDAGTLRLLSAGALGGSGGGTSAGSGATLQLQGSLTIADEPLTLSGTGALQNLSGDNTWSGPITLQPGPIGIGVDAGSLTLSGVVSGSTGLTKVGPGTLVLSNANTYSGTTTVNAGTLSVGGSTGAVAISGTGRLSGSGAVGAIALGGTGSVAPVATLDAASLAWEGTASLEFQLGPTGAPVDRLVLSGALTKGTGTTFLVRFSDAASGPPEAGLAYVIATYASTTFAPADLRHTYNGNPGMSSMPGAFFVDPTQMEFEALAVALFIDGFE